MAAERTNRENEHKSDFFTKIAHLLHDASKEHEYESVLLPEVVQHLSNYPSRGAASADLVHAPSILSDDGAEGVVRDMWQELSAPLRTPKKSEQLEAYQALHQMTGRLERRLADTSDEIYRGLGRHVYLSLLLDYCQDLPESEEEAEISEVAPSGIAVSQIFDSYAVSLTKEAYRDQGYVTQVVRYSSQVAKTVSIGEIEGSPAS